jgi:hypothetical protein
MFLVHPTLSEQNIQDTCRAVEKVMAAASSPQISVTTDTF